MDSSTASLVDILDHLLAKGVVLDAEVMIGLADVPLLALHLGAFLAAIDTMERFIPGWSASAPERRCSPSSALR